MSKLFKGQKDNKMSSVLRVLFSLLLVASVISFVSNYNQNTVVSDQMNSSFAPEMSMLPVGTDIEAGKALYMAKACFACHGMNGEGNAIGPNLVDDFAKKGCSEEDITNVIAKGVAGTTMVAFEAQLKPEEIKQLTAYIVSLKGTKPANAKAAEGDKCK